MFSLCKSLFLLRELHLVLNSFIPSLAIWHQKEAKFVTYSLWKRGEGVRCTLHRFIQVDKRRSFACSKWLGKFLLVARSNIPPEHLISNERAMRRWASSHAKLRCKLPHFTTGFSRRHFSKKMHLLLKGGLRCSIQNPSGFFFKQDKKSHLGNKSAYLLEKSEENFLGF